MKNLFLINFILISYLTSKTQDVIYYIESNSVLTKIKGNPNDMSNVVYWKIRLYKDNHTKWGGIIGKTYTEAMDELKRCQETQREYEKLINQSYDLTYFNYQGPIAILKNSVIQGSGKEINLANKIINIWERTKKYCEYSKKAKEVYDNYLENYSEFANQYKDIGNVLKEYAYLLQNNQFRINKISDKLDQGFLLDFNNLENEINSVTKQIEASQIKINGIETKIASYAIKHSKSLNGLVAFSSDGDRKWTLNVQDKYIKYLEESPSLLIVNGNQTIESISWITTRENILSVQQYSNLSITISFNKPVESTDSGLSDTEWIKEAKLDFTEESTLNNYLKKINSLKVKKVLQRTR